MHVWLSWQLSEPPGPSFPNAVIGNPSSLSASDSGWTIGERMTVGDLDGFRSKPDNYMMNDSGRKNSFFR